MGWLHEHFNGVMNLLLGMSLAVPAWRVYAEHKSIFATVLRLTFGVAIATVGLLDLCGLFPRVLSVRQWASSS